MSDAEPCEQPRDSGLDFVQWSIREAARLAALSDDKLKACHRSSGRMLVSRGYVIDDDHGTAMLGAVLLMLFGFVSGWLFSPLGNATIREVTRLVTS